MKGTFKCPSYIEVRSALKMCNVLFEDISCIKRLFFLTVFQCMAMSSFVSQLVLFDGVKCRFYHPSLGYLLMLMMTDHGCYVCHVNCILPILFVTLLFRRPIFILFFG